MSSKAASGPIGGKLEADGLANRGTGVLKDLDDRFGMPESAFRAARESHGVDNPTLRLGMYVPTRREVVEKPPGWLTPVLIDWLWESPTELIPNNTQIAEVKTLLLARPDAADAIIIQLIAECDEYLAI